MLDCHVKKKLENTKYEDFIMLEKENKSPTLETCVNNKHQQIIDEYTNMIPVWDVNLETIVD